MLQGYGYNIGLKLLAAGNLGHSLKHLVIPVNYWRSIEYRPVMDGARFSEKDRVLDIGSPKLLSIYLADKVGATVYSTDIEPYFMSEYGRLRELLGIPPERLKISVEDGRKLTFSDAFFTRVYSVSVLEHIPDDGDAKTAAEIGRVLAPGGLCTITVPFSPQSRDIYTEKSFYWSGSSKSGGDGRVFYQRRYSEEDLHRRIIAPSGLKLRRLSYVGEKVCTKSRHEVGYYLPRISGPIQPLLSKLFHTKPADSWKDLARPLCAFVLLEKIEKN